MSLGGLTFNDLMATKNGHEQAIESLSINVFKLERNLEAVERQIEQRRGALAEIERLMKRVMEAPQQPPETDPNAESDQ